MGNESSEPRIETQCAHLGLQRHGDDAPCSSVVAPIEQTTIFDLGTSAEAEAVFAGDRPGHTYSRFGNPTVERLSKAICSLEGGAGALVTSSGNAATLCAIVAAMRGRSGPLVTHPDIYGGSSELLRLLAETFAIHVERIDPQAASQWQEACAGAGAVLVETPSNPLMRLIDIRATADATRGAAAPLIVDNTIATPYNQQPLALGADWVVHSTTKYLNGHSDMVGGCVVKRTALLPEDRSVHKNLGGTVNAIDAWLVMRGMRTFALRMEAHNRNGKRIADWLRQRSDVSRVFFADGHADATVFNRQMRHGGAVVSFEVAGGADAAARFIDRLRLVTHAVSLGGMESLVTRPAMSSHRGMSARERCDAGIADGLVRLSVGIENADDLIADLDQALAGHDS